ncbi:MAG: hypothetical protein CVV41_12155 [Candidatus Riflebacteria bacterium HGW-Riflebacteria-1]|jgi:prepilin-type N-terminal cleavage/methylation domain-containing protein|nr:MAG: hypothetical protein CVV41_12155 [Candidatus Riflebacteria bacterium HGW-Riflebacteria-1]
MNSSRAGFTLMEIMVVIIVIAVLASVAGPMIGSITDQGRASATKSKMSALKSAMLTYQSDVGRFPFCGAPNVAGCVVAYGCAATWTNTVREVILGDNPSCNVLLNEAIFNSGNTAFGIANYVNRKWKGPYMDADPMDFMYDSWSTKFVYGVNGSNLYLWSSGADTAFASIAQATNAAAVSAGDCDDIIISLMRARKPFN